MTQSPDHPELRFVEAAGYTVGRPDGPPLWLIVHTMEAGESSTRAENTAAYFANPGDGRQVSAHYCWDNDSGIQCVRLRDSAWTVGNRQGNNRGINHEFAGFAGQTPAQWGDAYSQAMLRRAAPYFRSDAIRYGIPLRRCSVTDLRAFRPGVTSHNDLRLAFDITTHTDPGPNFPWTWFINLLNEEDDMTAEEVWAVQFRDYVADEAGNRPPITTAQALYSARSDAFNAHAQTEALQDDMIAVKADLAELKARPPVESAPVDQVALQAAVAAAMTDPATLAAIANAVNDDAAARGAE